MIRYSHEGTRFRPRYELCWRARRIGGEDNPGWGSSLLSACDALCRGSYVGYSTFTCVHVFWANEGMGSKIPVDLDRCAFESNRSWQWLDASSCRAHEGQVILERTLASLQERCAR